MANDHVVLHDGQGMQVNEFFEAVKEGRLEGYSMRADGGVDLPDGSVIDENGVRTMPEGNVLFPTDELGFMELVDASAITTACARHSRNEIDATELWATIDAEVEREPELADMAESIAKHTPRP